MMARIIGGLFFVAALIVLGCVAANLMNPTPPPKKPAVAMQPSLSAGRGGSPLATPASVRAPTPSPPRNPLIPGSGSGAGMAGGAMGSGAMGGGMANAGMGGGRGGNTSPMMTPQLPLPPQPIAAQPVPRPNVPALRPDDQGLAAPAPTTPAKAGASSATASLPQPTHSVSSTLGTAASESSQLRPH
jgi:hypothetical protein